MTPRKRVLVVDDAATVRMYHRKLLGDAGWQVEEANNGVDALEHVVAQADGERFDLYVVDVNMPRLDGYGFVRELRRLDADHQAPVLMVSTEAKSQDAQVAFDAGSNAYLVKPARPHELVLDAALLIGDRDAALEAAARHLPTAGATA